MLLIWQVLQIRFLRQMLHALRFQAGADIILMPQNLDEAYQAVLAKVEDGTIMQERLNDSVIRILAVKIQRGMLSKEQIKQEKAADSTMSQQPASTAEVTAKATAKSREKQDRGKWIKEE